MTRWTAIALLAACSNGAAGGGSTASSASSSTSASGGGTSSSSSSSSGASSSSSTSSGSGGASAPDVIFDGALAGAKVPGWNAADPRPLVMAVQNTGATSWTFTIAQIDPEGAIGQVVADQVRVWGWSSGGPSVVYDGALDANAKIPGWSGPAPLILYVHAKGSTTWTSAIAQIDASGTIGNVAGDGVRAYAWSSGAPRSVYAGGLSGARVDAWDAKAPRPLLFAALPKGGASWDVAIAEIDATGAVGLVVADEIRVWGF